MLGFVAAIGLGVAAQGLGLVYVARNDEIRVCGMGWD